MNRFRVKLFSLSTCSHCKAVKKILAQYHIDVDVIDVDRLEGDTRKKALKEVKQYNDRVTFPTTVIGEKVIVGNKIDRIKTALEASQPSTDERG
ncbi:MAG: glutaredoxin family protein [Desulfosarcina sp.]